MIGLGTPLHFCRNFFEETQAPLEAHGDIWPILAAAGHGQNLQPPK